MGDELWELVLAGGYPEVLTRAGRRRRREWHLDYVEAVVQRDIARVGQLSEMPRLLRVLAEHAGQPVNVRRLEGDGPTSNAVSPSGLRPDSMRNGRTTVRHKRLGVQSEAASDQRMAENGPVDFCCPSLLLIVDSRLVELAQQPGPFALAAPLVPVLLNRPFADFRRRIPDLGACSRCRLQRKLR